MLSMRVAAAPPPRHPPARRRPYQAAAVAAAITAAALLAVALVHGAAPPSLGAGSGGDAVRVADAARRVAGRDVPALAPWVATRCAHLAKEHEPLVDAALAPWTRGGGGGDGGWAQSPAAAAPPRLPLTAVWASTTTSSDKMAALIIKNNTLYLDGWNQNLTPVYIKTLTRLARHAALPDTVLPLNPGDDPLVRVSDGGSGAPRPMFSFCVRPGYADVPFPNQHDGSVDAPPPENAMWVRGRRVGRGDPRAPTAFFRLTPGALGGLPKGRGALINLSLRRPDLIDAGIDAWSPAAAAAFAARNETRAGRLKPHVSPRNLASRHRYTVWAPGNCASVRLASQLASDLLTFVVASDETEWYYSLLTPWKQFVPVAGGDCAGDETAPDGLPARIAWARAHEDEAAAIVRRARRFAARHVSDRGVDCYVGRLLLAWAALVEGGVEVPAGAAQV